MGLLSACAGMVVKRNMRLPNAQALKAQAGTLNTKTSDGLTVGLVDFSFVDDSMLCHPSNAYLPWQIATLLALSLDVRSIKYYGHTRRQSYQFEHGNQHETTHRAFTHLNPSYQNLLKDKLTHYLPLTYKGLVCECSSGAQLRARMLESARTSDEEGVDLTFFFLNYPKRSRLFDAEAFCKTPLNMVSENQLVVFAPNYDLRTPFQSDSFLTKALHRDRKVRLIQSNETAMDALSKHIQEILLSTKS